MGFDMSHGFLAMFSGAAATPTRFGIASNRNKIPDTTQTIQMCSTRAIKKTGNSAVSDIVIRCPWFYVTSSNVETLVGNGASITASIEYPVSSGIFYQATIGGNPTLTVVDGTSPDFDPINLTIPANTKFALHCWLNAGAAGKFPYTCYLSTARWGDGIELGASLVDKTMIGGESSNNTAGIRGYSPLVFGTVLKNARDCIIAGDSVSVGDVESSDVAGGDTDGNLGPLERLLGLNSFANLNMGRSGTKASQWQAVGAMTKRLDAARGLTGANKVKRVINELAHNDWAASNASWMGYMGIINGNFAPYSQKITGCTTTPYVDSSSDGYLTQGGQVLHPSSNLNQFNITVRAGTILWQNGGYIDLSAAVANPVDQSYWKTPGDTGYAPIPTQALTGDGTHPILYGNTFAVPLIDASALLT